MEDHLESLADLPTIHLSLLRQDPHSRSLIVEKISEACHRYGFFHVINHGVPDSVIEDALDVNGQFFEMPMAEKEELMSDDIFKEVRFGRLQVGDFSRDFLKLYAHPLGDFISSWPRFPPDYREKMRMYSAEVRKVCIELFAAIMESLNLDGTYMKENFKHGIQMLGINFYNPCLGSNMKSGAHPHTDHSIITLLLQSAPGLQVVDRVNGWSWKKVPELKGSLEVLVGDHLEVISNGFYKSVFHRVIPICNSTRLSISNFHSLAMDEIVEPAAKLVSEENPRYRGSSLKDILKHLASGDARAFTETLKTGKVNS